MKESATSTTVEDVPTMKTKSKLSCRRHLKAAAVTSQRPSSVPRQRCSTSTTASTPPSWLAGSRIVLPMSVLSRSMSSDAGHVLPLCSVKLTPAAAAELPLSAAAGRWELLSSLFHSATKSFLKRAARPIRSILAAF